MAAKISHETFLERVFNRYGEEYTVLGKYVRSQDPILLRHNTCGNEWETTSPNDFLKEKPNKCPKCAPFRSWALSTEEYQAKINSVYGVNTYIVTGTYINNKSDTEVMHKCGFKMKLKPNYFMNGNHHCSNCERTISKIAKVIESILNKLEIEYETEKTFDWLRFELPLKIDFFLPEYNIALEADGEQHYLPKRGGEEEFNKTLIRDRTKYKLCKENSIELFRIPSFLAPKEAEVVLLKFLFDNEIYSI